MIPLSEPEMLSLSPDANDLPFIHPQALVETAKIGPRTRVWAFAHVCSGSLVGADCNICDHTFIEKGVIIGDRVTVKCGVQLWTGTTIEDDVFIGPNVTFTNDARPRSRRHPEQYEGITVRRGASIGAGAVLLPGIEIGAYALVGAGSVVTRSVPPQAQVVGNPARKTAEVCRCGRKLSRFELPPWCQECAEKEAHNAA